MPRRPDTLESVVLAIELLRRIPRGRKVTASELHRQLKDAGMERDLRTIQRLLELFSKSFDVERDDRSKPYGYRWLEQARGMALPHLTPQESLLLLLAEQQLKPLLPPRVMKSMSGFFSQARRNLGPDTSERLAREWPQKVRVVATSQPLLPPKVAAGVFDTVSDALYANRWLHVDYRNVAGKHTRSDVMPLGLVQQGPCLYLVGRFRGFDNERNLALHRIVSVRMSDETFERPKNFDLARYDADGRFAFGEGKRVKLKFRIDREAGAHLLETPLAEDQTVKEVGDGEYEVTATVVDSGMLGWWLRGFGGAVSGIRRQRIVVKRRGCGGGHKPA